MNKTISEIQKFEDNEKKLKSNKSFVLKNVFKNVAKLEVDDSVSSEEKEHFNAKWSMEIMRNGRHLEFFVWWEPITHLEENWAIETKMEYSMMGSDDYNVTKTIEHCFDSYKEYYKFSRFVEWEDINEYLIDNNLTVQVKVEILEIIDFEEERIRNFDESQEEDSDVILVVGYTKFYVLKKYLALQSSYFKALFFGKFSESQKNVVELKDVDPNDFQKFLELIYGESSVNDDNVTGILRLADMYDAPTAIRRCEEFLMEKSKKSMVQKLQLSLRCNLENLKNKCLSEVSTFSDVESIIAANLPEFNFSTSKALLQKCIDFSKK
ncbi:hypothetical protein B9Z55_009190 [Caenorhabditis nigoni]|uniref:BTB domain-containing protein n=1 Tax=Caenorhabditis nigoni TaxID=1611254 RepID=A0A2G5UR14_9PELO|nr:hypothetical protein B9Z55_009190 [Caenorhabditis nigoni]